MRGAVTQRQAQDAKPGEEDIAKKDADVRVIAMACMLARGFRLGWLRSHAAKVSRLKALDAELTSRKRAPGAPKMTPRVT